MIKPIKPVRAAAAPILWIGLHLLMVMGVSAQTYDGYTLYSKMGNNSVFLLDMDKSVYHSWNTSRQTGYSVYLLSNQHILRGIQKSGNQLSGAGMCGMVQEIDWNNTVIWEYTYSTSAYCTHHDIEPMPNGNVLLIAYEVKSASEVTQAGGAQSIVMWPDKIVEVQPQGATGGIIVWEWHAWDHLVQDHDASKSNFGVVADHPELLNINYQQQKEWMHVNSVKYNASLDQIVISSHNLNEFYVIDHSTTTAQAASHTGGNAGMGGDILYRWGNPAAYNRGTTANRVFNVVHDAHWVPEGCPMAGYLVGFNNKGINNNQSCIDLISPPLSGYNYTINAGAAYAPSSYTWRHACLQSSSNQSNSQQLPNGNMLICIASSGYIYEINQNQTVVWSHTVGGTTAKAFRYSGCYVNGGITATASASPPALCSSGSSQLNVTVSGSAATTYSWSSIPAGFTSAIQNPEVAPLTTTRYIVVVSDGACSASDSVTVTVVTPPAVPVITYAGDSLMSSALVGNQWYLDGTQLTGATGQYFFPQQPGSYQVEVIDGYGCTSGLSEPLVVVSTEERTTIPRLTVWPNPVYETLYVTVPGEPTGNMHLMIFNSMGSVVMNELYRNQYDLSHLPGGLYLVTVIKNGNLLATGRIVVIR